MTKPDESAEKVMHLRVMYLEDAAVDAAYFKRVAANTNGTIKAEVTVVSTLKEAKAVCDEFDALVVDLNLPDANPHDVLTWLMTIPKGKPTAVLTSTEDEKIFHSLGFLRVQSARKFQNVAHVKSLLYWLAGAHEHFQDLQRMRRELARISA